MTELNQVFDGDLAEHVFIIASVICGFVRRWNSAHAADRRQIPLDGISR